MSQVDSQVEHEHNLFIRGVNYVNSNIIRIYLTLTTTNL